MLVMVPLRLASDPVFSTFYSDRKYPLLGRKYPFAATRAGGRPESGLGHGVSVSVRIAVKPDNRSEPDCTVLDFRCPLGLIYLSQSQISMGQYPQRMRPKQVVPLALALPDHRFVYRYSRPMWLDSVVVQQGLAPTGPPPRLSKTGTV